jgi:hypothetical protein
MAEQQAIKSRNGVFKAEPPVQERKLQIKEAKTFRLPIPYKEGPEKYGVIWHTFEVPETGGTVFESGKSVQVALDSWRRALDVAVFELKDKLGFK